MSEDYSDRVEYLLENFELLSSTPEALKRLEEKILEWAVQGKLGTQDEGDEPAQKLVKRIHLEKESKSIGRKDNLKIPVSKKPFDIPKTWVWIHLESLGITQTGATPSTATPENYGNDFPFIRPSDISDDTNITINYSSNGLTEIGIKKGRLIKSGSILMVCIGTVGKVGYVDKDCSCNQQINVLTPFEAINVKCLTYFMRSEYFQKCAKENASKTTIPILNKSKWSSILLPLPPREEQQRIVEKIEYLLEHVRVIGEKLQKSRHDREKLNQAALGRLLAAENAELFEERWQFIIENFDTLYSEHQNVGALKQTILELAVRGMLVRQEAGDEPASELLKRIKAEKKRLVEEGKITKEKMLPSIKENEKPFELPKGWEVCRAKDVITFITSGSRGWAKFYSDDGVIFIRIGNLNYEDLNLDMKFIQYVTPPEGPESFRTSVKPNDILISITGDIGMTAIVPPTIGKAHINQHIALNRPSNYIWSEFLAYIFMSPFGQKQLGKAKRGIKNSLALTDIENVIVPLPPYKEQKRITKKLQTMLSMCDELSQKLQISEREHERWVESVLA